MFQVGGSAISAGFVWPRFWTISLGVIAFLTGCSALGVRSVTPPNAPPDISYLFPNHSLGPNVMAIGGHGYFDHEIVAAADGVVVLVNMGQRGYHLRLWHGAVGERDIYTDYYHVFENALKIGDVVKRGQVIGSIRRKGVGRSQGTVHYHYLVVGKPANTEKYSSLTPHDYWFGIDRYKVEREKSAATSPFMIPCFDPTEPYQREPIRFTYPAVCKNW